MGCHVLLQGIFLTQGLNLCLSCLLHWHHQVPLSMGFSRQEYLSGLPCPPPGDLTSPGIQCASLPSPPLAGGFFTTNLPGKASPHLQTSSSGTWATLGLHVPHTHTSPPSVSSLCELIVVVMRVSFGTWPVSTCRKPDQICGPGRDRKIEF